MSIVELRDKLVKEESDLFDKIDKLEDYIDSGMVGATKRQKSLLEQQLGAMKDYDLILERRIKDINDRI